jgi:hypothetical protein
MRYMLLIYSKEQPDGTRPEISKQNIHGHWALMDEATRKGVFIAAEPLSPTAAATTVRVANGETLITDGPFAETKEQLAGYYMLDCENLDDAIEWAARIPTACKGGVGCVEIRPLPGLPARPEPQAVPDYALAPNG